MPAAADDPFARRRPGRRGGDHVDDLGPTLRVTKVEDHECATEARIVAVALDEAGYQHLATEVDDLGVITAIGEHRGIGTNSEDMIALDCDSLGARLAGIDRHDIGIDEKQVGNRYLLVR